MHHGIAIGKVAAAAGVKIPTIRYYEQIGLLPAPDRTEGNRRTYSQSEVDRLTFIRHSRELGFGIDEIRTLLTLQDAPHQSCHEADSIAKAHLIEVDQKIASLTALKAELQRMVDGCTHGGVETCQVIEILADHGKCAYHDHAETTHAAA